MNLGAVNLDPSIEDLREILSWSSQEEIDERFRILCAHDPACLVIDDLLDTFKGFGSDEKLIGVILICSRSVSEVLRDTAVELLGAAKVRLPEVYDAVSERINDRWWPVRCSAMYAAGELRFFELTGKILERYRSGFLLERGWVLLALTMMRDESTKEFLERVLSRSRSLYLKYKAHGALAALGVGDSEDFLRSRLKSEEDPDLIYYLERIIEIVEELK